MLRHGLPTTISYYKTSIMSMFIFVCEPKLLHARPTFRLRATTSPLSNVTNLLWSSMIYCPVLKSLQPQLPLLPQLPLAKSVLEWSCSPWSEDVLASVSTSAEVSKMSGTEDRVSRVSCPNCDWIANVSRDVHQDIVFYVFCRREQPTEESISVGPHTTYYIHIYWNILYIQ